MRRMLVEDERFELGSRRIGTALPEQPLGKVAEEYVGAVQAVDQLVVRLLSQIELAGPRSVVVADTVQAAFEAVDAIRIAARILITVISVVPVKHIQAAI